MWTRNSLGECKEVLEVKVLLPAERLVEVLGGGLVVDALSKTFTF